MGAPEDSINHEDVEIVNLAQGRDFDGNLIDFPPDAISERLTRLVQARNETHDLWGWKDPSADLYLDTIAHVLRNPFVLFVNRDMAAIAKSELNQMQGSIEQGYEMALLRFGRYWALLQRMQWPTLLVSYERAALDPEALLCEIADFIGLEPPTKKQRDMVRKFGTERGYRQIEQQRRST
ncbi:MULTISPECIES: hypothetical protein [unclassified Mesorhizobium]|nr:MULTISPECIES: hypothetical protein [unclassified Mesorhizobium]TGQ11816.1 hypothetical protein EN862_012805 [Mesorhizobium sp. M2E.F.Ca.ET.219.01.1.1]TGS18148.1 hypothetical protein EN852_005860 [Mesorhizobium sp. M2E.F.Ca.ET.209.01.1.1]TGT70453.1 hypothetical protein EN809_021150 [Mesorhizobium sp. M2E.F.Ca.ET.166.01.1.1]TGV98688.1 hypothetical protein EN797_027340 [Mesorhizobium sp. M2E.F.Ca.ET.154.01.1.1]